MTLTIPSRTTLFMLPAQKAHIASISGSSSSHEHDSGEIACTFCKKGVTGEALIRYKYEDYYVDETLIFHRACEKPYLLFQAGKVHQCPKCKGFGVSVVNNSFCNLCDGDGMLEKPAIPIDWKKAP